MNARPRRTPAAPTETLEGVGLHSGISVSVRVLPAPPEAGIVFQQKTTGQEIPALAANVVETSRCTILGAGGSTVQTVEHLLSALAGLGIDDARIETDGGELPALDGSAAPFVSLLRAAGVAEAPGSPPVEALRLSRPCLVTGDDGARVVAIPSPEFEVTVVLDYPKYPWIGTQAFAWEEAAGNYEAEVAPARTYGFLAEIAWLQAHGLALGASYASGIALREDGYDVPLRFADELARHKLLDLVGDLSLIGRPLAARIVAVKPSHTLNCRLAAVLAKAAA